LWSSDDGSLVAARKQVDEGGGLGAELIEALHPEI